MKTPALAIAALAIWIAVYARTQPQAPAARDLLADAPALPAVEATCTASAALAELRAHNAIERYPFDPRQGLLALAWLAEASDCHRSAGDTAGADAATARMQAWRARVDRDYRDHLVRCRFAIAADRRTRAVAELEFLSALLDRAGGRFALQLRSARDALAAGDPNAALEQP